MVDTGGYAAHGGAFSGKDPSRLTVRRLRSPLCSQEHVAAGWLRKLQLQIAYAIGVAKPVSLAVRLSALNVSR